MAFEENSYDRLAELGGSKFEIVNDEPNITGWKVKTEDGLKVGIVDDLLFNPASQKVKYMVVNFSGNELHFEKDRQVLVPISVADLYSDKDYAKSIIQVSSTEHLTRKHAYDASQDGNVVVLAGVTIAQLNALPLYEKNHLSPDVERAIQKIFERPERTEMKEHAHYENHTRSKPPTDSHRSTTTNKK